MQKSLGVVFDIETILVAQATPKHWTIFAGPFGLHVAEPPRRKLDDVRFFLRVGPLAVGVVFAHWRGQTPDIML